MACWLAILQPFTQAAPWQPNIGAADKRPAFRRAER